MFFQWSMPKSVYYFSAMGTAVGIGYLIKDGVKGIKYEGEDDLTDKVVIITGANSGIGKATTHEFAKRNAKVIMACRDSEQCEITRRNIVLSTENKYIYCRKCDLASQESIREFVERFKKEHSKLHILINNAAVMKCPKSYTKEGIEMQLGVNHMGHFLLTNLLLDVLKNSVPARIINLTSAGHVRGKINVDDLNSAKNYDPIKSYDQSKLANLLFTKELARRLAGTGVTVNAVYPGVTDTQINRHLSYYNNNFTKLFVKPITWLISKTPTDGAQTVLYAALDPSLQDVTGSYLSNCAVAEASKETENEKLAKWLWLVSEKWTRLATN